MKAIVSGHSRGLGAAIAAELLQRGIAVMGLARQRNDHLSSLFGGLLIEHQLDLADSSVLTQWLHGSTLSDFVAMDDGILLVNNAGTVQPVGALGQQAVAAIATAVSLNVSAPLMLAAAVAALPCREQRILHIASGTGRDAYPAWSVYCATKAALDHHARAVACDSGNSVRICSIAPGVIDTDMQAELRAMAPERFALQAHFHAMQRDGELATPQACATRLVDFLLAPDFGAVATAALI